MLIEEGKYTLELFAEKNGLKKQSALNLLSKLKKQGVVNVTGGGKQKRIYLINKIPKQKTNGLFDLLNKYSPEKIQPFFEHHIYGKYTVERAIIDSILLQKKQKDIRLKEASYHLFRNIKNWKTLFDMAKKRNIEKELKILYFEARQKTKCKTMPKRYEHD